MSDPKLLLNHFYLKIDGTPASEELNRDMLEYSVESSLHLPDVATIIIHDPKLKWVDDTHFAPGKSIEITAKVGTVESLLFDGEIVELEPEFGVATQRLHVRAFDRLHRLARGRQARSFQNVTDGDLVNKIAAEVGLSTKVGPTPEVHDYVFQENETNLEFLQMRAARLGYLLYVQRKVLHFEPHKQNGTSVELKWGESLAEFRPRLTTLSQINQVTVRGWDPAKKQALVGQVKDASTSIRPAVGESESGGAAAKKAFSLDAPYLVANAPVHSQAMADKLAQSYADRFGGKFIEAEGLAGGNPQIVAGIEVKVTAVGQRFSGKYTVTAATHTYSGDQGYVTRFTISGMQPVTLVSMLTAAQEDAASDHLVVGVVTDNKDPKGYGRVKVKLPTMSEEHTSHWARVVAPGAGANRGIMFFPEVNDEVLVGFESGNMSRPYVIGGVWNGKDAPPLKVDDLLKGGNVNQRTIKTRTGFEILFDDDDKKQIQIKTPGGLTIRLSDSDKLIELKSANSTVKLDDQGNAVSIDTKGDLKLKATGKVSIEATAGMDLTSNTSVSIQGNSQVDVKSNGTLGLQGTASAELKSTGVLTVQGTLVKIN